MTSSKIIGYKIRPQGSDPCYFKDLGALLEEISDLLTYSEEGDRIIIDKIEMFNKDWEALPEHGGY